MSGDEWDARAEVDIATFIERYIAERPSPSGSLLLEDLSSFAGRLRDDGERRLRSLSARPLVAV